MALVEMDFEPRFCRARKYPVRWGENDCDGGVFSAQLKPPKSITGNPSNQNHD